MSIQIEIVADNSRLFRTSQPISALDRTYLDPKEALNSPVAAKLFGFPWVEQVRVKPEGVQVFKQDWVEWTVLEEPLRGLLEEHFANYQTNSIEENPHLEVGGNNLDSGDDAAVIAQLIESEINPALSSHGGFVVLHGVKDNQVFLEMGGGCQGCAMSYMTLKEGIENAIKNAVPTITAVVDVTNHDAGANPFYS